MSETIHNLPMPEGFQMLSWDKLPEGVDSWAEYWMKHFENERERRRNQQRIVESITRHLNHYHVPQGTHIWRIMWLLERADMLETQPLDLIDEDDSDVETRKSPPFYADPDD